MHFKTARNRQNIITIRPDHLNFQVKKFIDEMKTFISKEKHRNIILDLTDLNLLDCIRTGTLVATYHFIELLNGKVYLVVDSPEAQRSIEILGLTNTVVIQDKNQLLLENIA